MDRPDERPAHASTAMSGVGREVLKVADRRGVPAVGVEAVAGADHRPVIDGVGKAGVVVRVAGEQALEMGWAEGLWGAFCHE